jgi:alpha-beta hydrolase superfamily lysophospholipase
MRPGALLAALVAGVTAAAAAPWAAAGPAAGSASAAPLTAAPRPLVLRERCVTKAERRRVLRFKAVDGVRLIGVEFGRGQRVVVLAHQGGAPPNLCGWVPYARTLAAAGYRVLVFDHRKFGSSGRASHWRRADRVDFDVLGAIRTMRSRGARSIVLGGASLGGAAVLAAAPHATPAVDGVISFSSPRNYVNVNALAGVEASNTPVLFLAAVDDTPFSDDARALFEASPARDKRLEIYPGSEHGFRLLRNPSTRSVVDDFLAAHSAR